MPFARPWDGSAPGARITVAKGCKTLRKCNPFVTPKTGLYRYNVRKNVRKTTLCRLCGRVPARKVCVPRPLARRRSTAWGVLR